jgi:hypothetical protein
VDAVRCEPVSCREFNANPADPDKVPNPQIIGLIGHVNQWGLDQDAASPLHAQMYLPFAQIPEMDLKRNGLGSDVFLRQQAHGTTSLASLRARAVEFNSEFVLHSPEDMEKTVADSISSKRFTMVLLGIFAMMALLLASIGIYGVLSYMVGQRTWEIGVRMALGAQRFDVLRMVLRDGARMTLVGVAIGLIGALGLTRLMATMLFGIKPTDPITFGCCLAFRHRSAGMLSSSLPRHESGSHGGLAPRIGRAKLMP